MNGDLAHGTLNSRALVQRPVWDSTPAH